MDKLVSVIMPVYNAARFLEEAIHSVTQQTYRILELLVVDDCSTDNSLEIALKCAAGDDRIRVLRNDINSGVAETRNHGINEAKGAFIALLDADDVWAPDKLERQLQLAEKKQAQIIYSSYDFIDEKGGSVRRPFLVPEETDWKRMLNCSVIGNSTVLVSADALKGHRFNKNYYVEDYVLWMELLKVPVKAVGDSSVLVHYRQVSGQRSGNKLHAAKHRWIVFRDVLRIGLIRSVWAFACYAVNGMVKYYR